MKSDDLSSPAERRLKHASSVAWQRVDDEVIVLDIPRRNLVGLNSSGAALWEAMSRHVTLEQGIAEVARQFAQSPGAIRGDLANFAEDLVRGQLLVDGTIDPQLGPDGQAEAHQSGALAGQRGAAGAVVEGTAAAAEPLSYEQPCIAWQETLEEAGVFAACAKDPFGELGDQCNSAKFSAAS